MVAVRLLFLGSGGGLRRLGVRFGLFEGRERLLLLQDAQDARLDEEHVGVEPGPFMAGAHEVDDAVEAHLAAVGQRGHDLDHVVELEVLAGVHRHPELERHRVLRAEDTSDRCRCGHAVTSL